MQYWIILISIIGFIDLSKAYNCPKNCNCIRKNWRCTLNLKEVFDCGHIDNLDDLRLTLTVPSPDRSNSDYFRSTSNCKIAILNIQSHHIPNYDMFNGLYSLKKLFLNRIGNKSNRDNDISNPLLEYIYSITQVSIYNHNIPKISTSLFSECRSLEILKLYSLGIRVIQSRSFQYCIKLKELDIHSNKLTELKTSSFYGLKELNELSMSSNGIESIKESWPQLDNVKQLDLKYNKLSSLIADQFKGLSQLKDLYLDNNKINGISDEAFRGLNNLRTLSLKNNKLRVLNLNVLLPLSKSLSTLKLSQINCIENKVLSYKFKEVLKNQLERVISCKDITNRQKPNSYDPPTTTKEPLQVFSSEIKNVIITVSILLVIFIIVIFIISYICFTKKLRKYRGAPCFSHSSCPHSTNNDLPMNYLLNNYDPNHSRSPSQMGDIVPSATFCNFYPTAKPRSNGHISIGSSSYQPTRYMSVPANMNQAV